MKVRRESFVRRVWNNWCVEGRWWWRRHRLTVTLYFFVFFVAGVLYATGIAAYFGWLE